MTPLQAIDDMNKDFEKVNITLTATFRNSISDLQDKILQLKVSLHADKCDPHYLLPNFLGGG